MTPQIRVTAVQPGLFRVQVVGATVATNHQVSVPQDIIDLVDLDPDDPQSQESLVRESMMFLLERESATAILDRFSLDDIGVYFPEYRDEISRRMS